MYTIVKHLQTITTAALITLLAVSCKHDDLLVPKPNENIRPAADFIRNNYDFRLLYAALDYTGLVNELNGDGPFTILAVPDQGFNALGILTEAQVRNLNKDSLRHALLYHVLKKRRLKTTDIPTNGIDIRFETMAGESVYSSAITRDNSYYFDGARIVRNDIVLANGVLHVLNKMMQYQKGKTVKDFLAAQPQYSLFVAALKKTGKWDELSQRGPFTIFAPSNEAFTKQGLTLEAINELNPVIYNLDRLIGCYILYGKHFFVSDQAIFKAIGAEYVYKNELRNDDWFIQFGTNLMKNNPGDVFFTPFPELSLWKPNPDIPQLPDRIGIVEQNYSKPRPLSGYDKLCENGIVHDLHGLVALPADVIK
jgi:uncharacterized surface protein with fasciclin (FAS1) repeats